MTFRAVEVLTSAALVVAEDTRHSRHLLDHFGIRTPMLPYHEHNEAREAPRLVHRMLAGESIALISDAGTPLISDPGARLVRAAIEAGITVTPVPGASALLAAVVASGIVAERFAFLGFLARKGRDRSDAIELAVQLPMATVLYEAPNRTAATLADLALAGAAARDAVVARELTKQFEEVRRGTVHSLAAQFAEHAPRGEVVIVLGAPPEAPAATEEALREAAARLRAEGVATRDIASRLVRELGAARNVAYRIAHQPDPSGC